MSKIEQSGTEVRHNGFNLMLASYEVESCPIGRKINFLHEGEFEELPYEPKMVRSSSRGIL